MLDIFKRKGVMLPVDAVGYLVLASNSMMELAATSGMMITKGGELGVTDGTMLEPVENSGKQNNYMRSKTEIEICITF